MQNLLRAMNLAQQLFGIRSFRWKCELGSHREPTGPLLKTFDDVEHGVAALVGAYAQEAFLDYMLARRETIKPREREEVNPGKR